MTHSANQPLWGVKHSSLRHLEEDLVMLDDVNEAIMVHCLKERCASSSATSHSILLILHPCVAPLGVSDTPDVGWSHVLSLV